MRKPSAILGSAVFFIAAPGVVAGLVPWLLTARYAPPLAPWPHIVAGSFLIATGLGVLLHAFARFALEGMGTPAPVAPTDRLVIGGVYRHVRNPMYVAVVSIILGQAQIFAHWPLAAYGAIIAAVMATFVRIYEEPVLTQRYGTQYETYRANVPGWVPRITPWRGD
ncbi:isoprenylcysteine carboxylmethyltransferase family protein [Aminobacter sp. AP02]|uniref:methyltransferase family protein n=1 Tax=Aminobacter sp. AP02 TaxID=2135737 RepID=UPI000D6B7F9E|nr:isoprenylcysteine carboxylmethyltransferase family protein [Aminobacter sp. AP02]PWK72623.1 protein-S-isoprenylcysteine O-methyltransferase Ste14 [Aminobacter sp. AP02]